MGCNAVFVRSARLLLAFEQGLSTNGEIVYDWQQLPPSAIGLSVHLGGSSLRLDISIAADLLHEVDAA